MLPRDDDQVMLKVPYLLAVAERLFAADLLTQHQSFVDGGGKQAVVGARICLASRSTTTARA